MTDPDRQFAIAKQLILDKVETWDDAYLFFDELMQKFREYPHPLNAVEVMYTMYAFITTMRELPEEGDIKVLMDRMVRTIIYASEEKLGVHLEVSDRGMQNAAAARALAAAAAAQALAEYDAETPHTVH